MINPEHFALCIHAKQEGYRATISYNSTVFSAYVLFLHCLKDLHLAFIPLKVLLCAKIWLLSLGWMQNNPELKKVKTGEENGIKRIDFTKTYTPQTLSFLFFLWQIQYAFVLSHYILCSKYMYLLSKCCLYLHKLFTGWNGWNGIQYNFLLMEILFK